MGNTQSNEENPVPVEHSKQQQLKEQQSEQQQSEQSEPVELVPTSILMSHIKQAQKGNYHLSANDVQNIYNDPTCFEYLLTILKQSSFKSVMVSYDDIKTGSLRQIGRFYPIDDTYKKNNNKLKNNPEYNGLFCCDSSKSIGFTNDKELQDIASVIINWLLFAAYHKLNITDIIKKFKNFILNPPDKIKIIWTPNCTSSLNFPETSIGGNGELQIMDTEDDKLICKIQVLDSSSEEELKGKLKNITDNMDILKLFMGSLGMLIGLGFPESPYILVDGDIIKNDYYFGPEILKKLGIIPI